ncbi:MAG: pyridoxal phosphate-dependent aminotransferase, partial [Deltaproteobacteria bacterium]|nr:pyridoxal phosphate-dependent aminotransferase [Deltaproteobacteria bacterium]
MVIAKKINGFMTQASFIRKMFEEGIRLKQEYGAQNVFDFSLGNPNLDPPEAVKARLRELVSADIPGKHSYMPNAGYPETRAAVASEVSDFKGGALTADQIVMTCGAGGALNVILKTIMDPGDEVIIPAPFFVEYRFYVDNAGGVSRIVAPQEDFSLNLDAIRQAVTEKTKAVLINSPNNPTGKVFDEASIRGLAAVLTEKGKELRREIFLISDEPYSEIVYDGVEVPSVMKAYPHSFIASSYSKSLSLPGERIGYIAVNPDMAGLEEVMGGLTLCNRILGFVNAPALMQRAIAGLRGVRVDVETYRKKRDLLCDGLASVGYRIRKPEGAFYLFPRTPIADDVLFADALRKRRILTVPGSGFCGPGHIRIAYCVHDATILGAIEGFGEVLK